jgi:hypothetical protein
MKKLIIAVAAVAFLASCKKDYTCDCTIAGVTTKADLGKQKKDDAEATCNTSDTAAKLLGGSCTLNEK